MSHQSPLYVLSQPDVARLRAIVSLFSETVISLLDSREIQIPSPRPEEVMQTLDIFDQCQRLTIIDDDGERDG